MRARKRAAVAEEHAAWEAAILKYTDTTPLSTPPPSALSALPLGRSKSDSGAADPAADLICSSPSLPPAVLSSLVEVLPPNTPLPIVMPSRSSPDTETVKASGDDQVHASKTSAPRMWLTVSTPRCLLAMLRHVVSGRWLMRQRLVSRLCGSNVSIGLECSRSIW